MTMLAQNAIFGFGSQADKDTVATTWYRHRATRVGVSEQDDVRIFPAEIGGLPVPSGAYSAGPLNVGAFELYPRLKDVFGYLLYAATGQPTTVALQDATPAPDGSYKHTFTFGDVQALPWLSIRMHMKGDTAANDFGRVLIGNRILAMTFDFSSDGIVTANGSVLGRRWQLEDPALWSWANTFEDEDTVPIAPVEGSYFKIPGFSSNDLPMVAARVTLVSNPVDRRLNKVFGSPYMFDVTVTDQVAVVDATLLWEDPTLYRQIMTGSTTGTVWTPQVFEQDFDLLAEAPAIIPATAGNTDRKYSIKFYAPRMVWQVNNGLQMAGRNMVMLQLRGTALLQGSDYFTIELVNDKSAYTW